MVAHINCMLYRYHYCCSINEYILCIEIYILTHLCILFILCCRYKCRVFIIISLIIILLYSFKRNKLTINNC